MSCFALSMSCFCPLIERNKQMNMAMGVYIWGVFQEKDEMDEFDIHLTD